MISYRGCQVFEDLKVAEADEEVNIYEESKPVETHIKSVLWGLLRNKIFEVLPQQLVVGIVD